MNLKIGIIGVGVVGNALLTTLKNKHLDIIGYDKFKLEYSYNSDILKSDFIFISVPTPYSPEKNGYDLEPLNENLKFLAENNFQGLVINKCTVEPKTTQKFSQEYNLNLIHNPEFLNARSAQEDFENQSHIVLGKTTNCSLDLYQKLIDFYKFYWPGAEISECTSVESELMKIGVNSFYSVKVQFFNEIYLLSQKLENTDYNTVKDIMLKNNWINPMHTLVPGTDGKLSYGGMCLPKDSSSLLEFMRKMDTPSKVLEGTVMERNSMRND